MYLLTAIRTTNLIHQITDFQGTCDPCCYCVLLLRPSPRQAWASQVAQRVKKLPAMPETWVQSLGQEDPLEEEMATHSSILAWRIPWTGEPGGLQSMGSQRVRHS